MIMIIQQKMFDFTEKLYNTGIKWEKSKRFNLSEISSRSKRWI